MNGFWKFLKALLIIGALCVAALAIYKKFFAKKEEIIEDEDAEEALEEAEVIECEEAADEDVLEVPAEAVIEEEAEEATEE